VLLIGATVEINDLFRASSMDSVELEAEAASYRRYLTIAAGWNLIGVVLIAVARYRPSRAFLFGGVWALLIGAFLAAFHGIVFTPAELFVLVLNYRLGALLFIVGAIALTIIYLGEMRDLPAWGGRLKNVLRIVVAGLLFVLITGEIRDFVEHRLAVLVDPPQDDVTELENLKQLGLSGGWLLYSIGLMAVGLWRRSRILRIMSMALFGFTILKIFIYDLSFLDTLYRFISFLALGAILLVVSYLYQRYRAVILEPSRK
jgi:uncharacterized membrane protein